MRERAGGGRRKIDRIYPYRTPKNSALLIIITPFSKLLIYSYHMYTLHATNGNRMQEH